MNLISLETRINHSERARKSICRFCVRRFDLNYSLVLKAALRGDTIFPFSPLPEFQGTNDETNDSTGCPTSSASAVKTCSVVMTSLVGRTCLRAKLHRSLEDVFTSSVAMQLEDIKFLLGLPSRHPSSVPVNLVHDMSDVSVPIFAQDALSSEKTQTN